MRSVKDINIEISFRVLAKGVDCRLPLYQARFA